MEAHLAQCLACRHFAEDLQALDAALSARFQRVELPASFKASLLRRIDAAGPQLAPELIAQRRRALESEFQATSADLLRRVLRDRWGNILDGLGLLGVTLVVAFTAAQLVPRGPDFSKLLQGSMSQPVIIYAVWATGALSVVGAMWFGRKQNTRRVLGRLY